MPKQYHKNPRQITTKQMTMLGHDLLKYGDLSGVVHNLATDEIIGGNQRSKIFRLEDCEIVLTNELPEPDEQGTVGQGYVIWSGKRYAYRAVRWDDRTAEAANIIANKAGGTWDFDVLANEWEVDDLLAWGFEPFELGIVEEEEEPPADPGAQVDRAEELRQKWQVEPGQLWKLGEHRLICGNCTDAAVVERVMGGEKAQMMFTDPPYGVNYEGGHFHSGDVNIKRKWEKLANDDTTEIYPAFLPVALAVVDGPCYMWFADSKARDVYNAVHNNKCEVHALIIWHKTNATYAAMNAQYKQRHEPCLYFKPKGSTLRWCGDTTESTVWSQDRDGINEFHPTQKPVALAAKAIGNHDAETVVDFFLGSGTTLIACEQLSRRCRAVEISPAYVAVAIQRWADMTGQTPELMTE